MIRIDQQRTVIVVEKDDELTVRGNLELGNAELRLTGDIVIENQEDQHNG